MDPAYPGSGSDARPFAPANAPRRRAGSSPPTPLSARPATDLAPGEGRWYSAYHHADRLRPNASWWLPLDLAEEKRQQRLALSPRIPQEPSSYSGWPTTGPASDRLLLGMRSAKNKGHVDWVTWAQEAEDAATAAMRPLSADAADSGSRWWQHRHPNGSWWPNYGVVGEDGFLHWAGDWLGTVAAPPQLLPQAVAARRPGRGRSRSPSGERDIGDAPPLTSKLHAAFAEIAEPTEDEAAARRLELLDLLDHFAPRHVPPCANQQWWQLRTRLAERTSEPFVRWAEVTVALREVEAAIALSQRDLAQLASLERCQLELRREAAAAAPDVVCASLLSMPTLNCASAFAEARRLLRSCGSERLRRQLVYDGLLEPQWHLGSGDLVPSLARGHAITRVARLSAGLDEHPLGLAQEQVALGPHRAYFLVALPEPGDPFAAAPPLKHRIVAERRASAWSSFDVMGLGVFEGNAAYALARLEALWTAAVAYVVASCWVRPALFLRCYPRSSANVPHLHIVDLGPLARRHLDPAFGPWDLPVDDALAVLRDEAEAQHNAAASAGRSAPLPRAVPMPARRPQPMAGPLPDVVTAAFGSGGGAGRPWHLLAEDLMQPPPQPQPRPAAASGKAEARPWASWDYSREAMYPSVGMRPLGTSTSLLLAREAAAAAVGSELDEAMSELQQKLVKVRLTTQHAVEVLRDHGLGVCLCKSRDDPRGGPADGWPLSSADLPPMAGSEAFAVPAMAPPSERWAPAMEPAPMPPSVAAAPAAPPVVAGAAAPGEGPSGEAAGVTPAVRA